MESAPPMNDPANINASANAATTNTSAKAATTNTSAKAATRKRARVVHSYKKSARNDSDQLTSTMRLNDLVG